MADALIPALLRLEIDQAVVDGFFADGADPNQLVMVRWRTGRCFSTSPPHRTTHHPPINHTPSTHSLAHSLTHSLTRPSSPDKEYSTVGAGLEGVMRGG